MPPWIMLVVFAGVGAITSYGIQRRRRKAAERNAER
jgi:hypothetical protein